MSARSDLRDSNLTAVDTQLKKVEKARSFLLQIKNSEHVYKSSGFIVDDAGCADAFYDDIDTFITSLDRYISIIEKNRDIMVNNSGWAGEDD
jgi:chaperonin cofactor prefoldin